MNAAELWAEFDSARRAMAPPDAAFLEALGIASGDIRTLVGFTHADVAGALYEPAEQGGEAFVSPVMVDNAIGPESCAPARTCRSGQIVDLVCWHPRHPTGWALRTGSAEWLGCIEPQCLDPGPVAVWQSVLAWFQAGCTGLVLLTRSVPEQYRLLVDCRGGLVAEDAAHAAELRRVLSRPWPAPRVLIAKQQSRHDAA